MTKYIPSHENRCLSREFTPTEFIFRSTGQTSTQNFRFLVTGDQLLRGPRFWVHEYSRSSLSGRILYYRNAFLQLLPLIGPRITPPCDSVDIHQRLKWEHDAWSKTCDVIDTSADVRIKGLMSLLSEWVSRNRRQGRWTDRTNLDFKFGWNWDEKKFLHYRQHFCEVDISKKTFVDSHSKMNDHFSH